MAKAAFALEHFFEALADGTRLRLLNLIGDDEICVCYFVEVLGEPQSKISRHLAYLRRAGLVAARREGKWMHYRMVTPSHAGAARILADTVACLAEDRAMVQDRSRLARACCSPARFVSIAGAPTPARVERTRTAAGPRGAGARGTAYTCTGAVTGKGEQDDGAVDGGGGVCEGPRGPVCRRVEGAAEDSVGFDRSGACGRCAARGGVCR